jgi:hypothetical protein
MSRHRLDAQRRSNQERINMVGSSGNPPPERTPLGTVIEVEPEWVCCCCEQDIPMPSGGMSTPVGSFCGPCFTAYIEYLFNGSSTTFLNAIRRESERFIDQRISDLEDHLPLPVLKPTTVSDVAKGHKERFKAKLRALIQEDDDEELG